MLKIIYGKSRTGKTTYVYNLIKEKYESNITNNISSFLIVPEQFSMSTEEKLANYLNKGGLFNVEVLTLKRMAYRVFNELGINIQNISDIGKKIIIYNILNNGNFKMFNAANKGNIENILDIFSEFARYGVDTNSLSNLQCEDTRLKDKITDLTNIYEQYIQSVEANGKNYTNELEILLKYISSSKLLSNSDIYIDEFYGFTKQEYEIIFQLIQNNNVTITFCIDDTRVSNNELDIYNQNKIEYDKFITLCKKNKIEYEQIELKCEENSNVQNSEITHLQENIFAYPYNTYGRKSENIHLYSCTNTYTEIENIANHIIDNVKQGYRYSDIVVITRDIEKYQDAIWAIFNKYNIPYFLDCKTNISNNQISVLIFSLIDIVIDNFSYQSVFSYLKTGFLDVDIDDIYSLENYVIKWGIHGYKWGKPLQLDAKTDEQKEKLELLNNLRKRIIEPLIEFRKKSMKCKNVKEIVNIIYTFLQENGIESIIQKRIEEFKNSKMVELEKEYTDIWNYYNEVFEQLILGVGDKEVDIQEFKKLFEIGITNMQKAYIPLYKDCVIIGDIERTRTNGMRALYFIGTQNDKFPITYPTEGLLTNNDRIYLKQNEIQLAKNTNEKILLDEFNIYKVITMCKEKIIFSYVFNDLNGTSYRPSFLINKIKKMFDISEVCVDEQYILNNKVYLPDVSFENIFNNNIELLKWYKNNDIELYNKYVDICNFANNMEINLTEENVSRLYTEELKTSISRIEEYVRCPYSFYLKYVLKVKEKEIFTVKTLDVGNFNHQVLEKFFKYIIDNNIDLKQMNIDTCNEISEKIIDGMFENVNIDMIKQAKEYNVLRITLKKTLQRAIWILVIQIKNSSFKPVRYRG